MNQDQAFQEEQEAVERRRHEHWAEARRYIDCINLLFSSADPSPNRDRIKWRILLEALRFAMQTGTIDSEIARLLATTVEHALAGHGPPACWTRPPNRASDHPVIIKYRFAVAEFVVACEMKIISEKYPGRFLASEFRVSSRSISKWTTEFRNEAKQILDLRRECGVEDAVLAAEVRNRLDEAFVAYDQRRWNKKTVR